MYARILSSLFRYGKMMKSYGKGMARPGIRVSGKTSKGRKVSGVMKKDKKGGNYVVSNMGVSNKVSAGDASKFVSKAKIKSNIRKGTAIGAVAGVGTLAASKTATNTSPEPVATESNPMGMKFSEAPKMSTKKQTFSQAFSQARKQGEGTNFKWQGKSYTAVTKDDVKRAGAKNLRGYLNKKKKEKK